MATDFPIPRLSLSTNLNVKFLLEYALRNEACLFESEFTDGWTARRDWVRADDGGPNLELLAREFGRIARSSCII